VSVIEFNLSPAPTDQKDPPARWYWMLLLDAEFRGVLASSHGDWDTEAEARADWAGFVARANGAVEAVPVVPIVEEPGLFS
jgi:hypothetical protein